MLIILWLDIESALDNEGHPESPLGQRSPNFLASPTNFVEDNFSMEQGVGGGIDWGWFKHTALFKTFYFILEYSQLTMLW